MAEWISVKDRLPKTGRLLLVRVNDCNLPAMAIFIGGPNKYWKIQPLFSGWYATNNKVTHWWPVPELLAQLKKTKEWLACVNDKENKNIFNVTINTELTQAEFEEMVERAMSAWKRYRCD